MSVYGEESKSSGVAKSDFYFTFLCGTRTYTRENVIKGNKAGPAKQHRLYYDGFPLHVMSFSSREMWNKNQTFFHHMQQNTNIM